MDIVIGAGYNYNVAVRWFFIPVVGTVDAAASGGY